MLVTRRILIMSTQVPILLLKEGSTETKDKDAQRNNINILFYLLKEIEFEG